MTVKPIDLQINLAHTIDVAKQQSVHKHHMAALQDNKAAELARQHKQADRSVEELKSMDNTDKRVKPDDSEKRRHGRHRQDDKRRRQQNQDGHIDTEA